MQGSGGCSWNCYKTLTFCSLQNPLCLPREMTSERPRVRRTPQFFHFWLRNVLRATTACTFSTSQLPKVSRGWGVFVNFDCQMCFAPQRRALSQHLNFQKCSEPISFSRFWLPNVTTFQPSVATNHWKKHSVSRLYYLFAHLDLLSSRSSFFWLLLFADLLSSSLLFSSLLWLFPPLLFICPYCWKFDF